MCNINALYKKTNNIKDNLGFIMSVTSNSFSFNNHGEGFYCDNKDFLFKSKEKINYYKFNKKIKHSKIIITHQRFSTSGYEVKYNHPFKNKDFVFCHNGIINQFKKDVGSDSSGFFEDFNKCFNKYLKLNYNREKSIIKAIKELFLKDLGSYSILIHDKIENVSYYFKDYSTTIYFYKNNEYLFITTSYSNSNFLKMLNCNDDFKEIKIKDNTIYKINKNCEVLNIGKIRKENKRYNIVIKSLDIDKIKKEVEVKVKPIKSNLEKNFDYLDDDINEVFTKEEIKQFSEEDLKFIENQNKKRVKFNNYEQNFDYINKMCEGC